MAGAVSVSDLASHTPPLRVRELGEVVSAAARAVSLAMGSRRTGAHGASLAR